MDSPAGHGYLHFGGRDASADGVEVADRCRGLHFVHNVSLHACWRPGPAPLAAWAPLNLESRGWRAGARRTGERAGENTVHTNLQSAVRRTGNSMESLIGGCSGEAINLAEGGVGGVTCPGRLSAKLRGFPGKDWALLPEELWKVKDVNSSPPVCILLHAGLRLHSHSLQIRAVDRWRTPFILVQIAF